MTKLEMQNLLRKLLGKLSFYYKGYHDKLDSVPSVSMDHNTGYCAGAMEVLSYVIIELEELLSQLDDEE